MLVYFGMYLRALIECLDDLQLLGCWQDDRKMLVCFGMHLRALFECPDDHQLLVSWLDDRMMLYMIVQMT